jgi:hypothetical protein
MRFLECVDGPYEGHVVLVPEGCREIDVRGANTRTRPTRYDVHQLGSGEFVLRHDESNAPVRRKRAGSAAAKPLLEGSAECVPSSDRAGGSGR